MGSQPSPSSQLVLCPNRLEAERVFSDLSSFRSNVASFFSWEVLPFEALSPSSAVSVARLRTLSCLAKGQSLFVVSTPEALMQRIISRETLHGCSERLVKGQSLVRTELIERLDALGFQRVSLLDSPGQYAARGSVIDVYAVGSAYPVRLEISDSKVHSIRELDPETQRSKSMVSETEIGLAKEFFYTARDLPGYISRLATRAGEIGLPMSRVAELRTALEEDLEWPGIEGLLSIFEDKTETLFDHLGSEVNIHLYQPEEVFESAEFFEGMLNERAEYRLKEGSLFPKPERAFLNSKQLLELVEARETQVYSSGIEAKDSKQFQQLSEIEQAISLNRFKDQPFEKVFELLRESNTKCLFIAPSPKRAKKLVGLLESYGVSLQLEPLPVWELLSNISNLDSYSVGVGNLEESFYSSELDLNFLNESLFFSDSKQLKPKLAKRSIKKLLSSGESYSEGDFVVHTEYGIARYGGLKNLKVEGGEGDFLLLEYAEGAKLFLPADKIGSVHKYVGVEGAVPKLSVLGGSTWAKGRAKVEKRVAEMAGQLLELYAERDTVSRPAYPTADESEARFKDSFPFELTEDQAKAINSVLKDLESSKPMDRLVCGDVGYGKTEVAMQAAYRVASSGKQVAVLVPTTVLASQHYVNFAERFSDTALRVDYVSRFRGTAKNKEVLAELAKGKIDIIVGTHRLLQRDVLFSDLGLVVIDEEHRFGVAHKERLKQLRLDVDILTLTATPIPRTLQLSILDVRDLSLIETPPSDRQVIQTYLGSRDPALIRRAILRELSRDGQVFYLHNKVKSIAAVKKELSELVPEARFSVGHGQMAEKDLERVMLDFFEHKSDVLICTTIIESGLDISNANTMIVNDAHALGLAQLYQIRGRVGRSSRRAYCYLLVKDEKKLGAAASKRLSVLRSLDDLGMGFRLAVQDMEIRGAGNLLGSDQSGNVNVIGFELFTKILKRAIQQLRGSQVEEERIDPDVSIGFPAWIPESYIVDVGERLLLYQRLVQIRTKEEAIALAEETEDCFGRYPVEIHNLIELMTLKAALADSGIEMAKLTDKYLSLGVHSSSEIDRAGLMELVASQPNKYSLSSSGRLRVDVEGLEFSSPADVLSQVQSVLGQVGFSGNKT